MLRVMNTRTALVERCLFDLAGISFTRPTESAAVAGCCGRSTGWTAATGLIAVLV